MAKPTKLDTPYVRVHCRRLAAALLSVGVGFARGLPAACRVVSDGGEKLDPPEETYHLALRTSEGFTHTKSLMEAWEDVGKAKEGDELDAVGFLNKSLGDLRQKLAGNPDALKILNHVEAILPCVAISFMRTFAITYGSLNKSQDKIVSYDRTYARVDRRKQRKQQLERQRDKINAELRDLDRQLADNPPKFFFPRLRLHRDNDNERSA